MSFKINDILFYKSIKLTLTVVLLIIIGQVYSQVSITLPSLTLTACNTFPTAADTLGNIVIAESLPNDIKSSGNLILKTPANFQFTNAGIGSALGSEITGISIILSSDTTITLSFTVNDTAQLDTLNISGIQIIATTQATTSSSITNSGGTAIISGEGLGAMHATVASTNAPTLSSSLSISAICSGDTVNYIPTSLIATTFNWTRDSIAGISNPSNIGTNNLNEILTNTTNSAITVLYIYTLSYNGCTNMDSVTVVVNPKPSLSIISNDTICNANAILIPLSSTVNSAYTWFANDNSNTTDESITNQQTDTIYNIITNNGETIERVSYSIIPTTINGSCIGDTTLFFIDIMPTVTVNAINDFTACYQLELSEPLSSNVVATFSWNTASNDSILGESSTPIISDTIIQTLVNNDTSMQTLQYFVTPTSLVKGCVGVVDTFNVILNGSNRMTSNDSMNTCSGNALNLKLTSEVNSYYNWVATDNINVSGESTTLQSNDTITDVLINLTNTVQTINYTITPTAYSSGCAGTVQNLTVLLQPNLNLITNHTLAFCSGTSNTIGSNPANNCTYSWTPSNYLNDTTISNPLQTATNNSNTPFTIKYYLVVTDTISSCQINDSVSVTINTQPVLNINNPATVCLPTTINLTDSLVTSGSSNGTLSYWTNYAATDTLYSPNTISSSDTNFIKITATGGCFDIDSVITVVNQQVIANAGQDVAICSGTIDSIGIDAINGIIYSWAPGLGLSDSTISNPIIVAINTTLNPYTTTYILTATDTITSCQSVDTISVTINPQPLLIINQPTAICQPYSINLTDSSITQGSIGGNTFSYWQNTSATDTLLSTQINSTDTNFIKLTAIGGCFAIDSVITIINPSPAATGGSDLSICSGTIGTIGSPAINGYNYIWTPGLGLSDSAISQPQNTLTNNTNTPIITTYKLTTTITATGCNKYDTISVTVNPQPNLQINQPEISCASSPIDITDSIITAGSTINVVYSYWNDVDATDTLLTPTAIGITDTNYVKITAVGGCFAIKPVYTSINPPTLVNFTGLNYSNCYNASPQVLTGYPAGGTFSGNGVVADTFTASNAGPGTQPVTYTYIDSNGCVNSTSQFIQILAPTNLTAEICMVTVNSQSNHNVIYWNKNQYTNNVDSFIVYRETLPDSFQRIVSLPYVSIGQYADTASAIYFPYTGNPNTSANRYKLQVRDTCGVYTSLSKLHQTMHLTNNEGTFSWTPYMIDTSSNPITELTSYVLLRDGNNTGNWDVIASTSPSVLTVADPDYTSYPNGRWKIETLWSISCNPSNPINKSTSNIVTDTSTIGITVNKADSISLNIYPNPYSNNTNISYSLNAKSEITIEVYNATGQKVITLLNTVQQKGKYSYPFSAKELGYNSGIYFVRMNVNGVNTIKRIVETD